MLYKIYAAHRLKTQFYDFLIFFLPTGNPDIQAFDLISSENYLRKFTFKNEIYLEKCV